MTGYLRPARQLKLAGERFHKLLVIEFVEHDKYSHRLWLCRCDCGAELVRKTSQLMQARKNGFAGCRECYLKYASSISLTHGDSRGDDGGTRLYKKWMSMNDRCRNPRRRDFKHYGGKGVKLCDAWQDFAVFKEWALSHGYEDHLTIERKDSNGHYHPDNCEWITHSENVARSNRGRNRRLKLVG